MTKRFESENVGATGESPGIGRMIAVSFAQEMAGVAIDYSSNDDQAHKTEKRILNHCSTAADDEGKALVVKANVSGVHEAIPKPKYSGYSVGRKKRDRSRAGLYLSRVG